MSWHSISADEVLKKLNSQRRGLSEAEVQARLAKHGLNVLSTRKKTPLIVVFLRQFLSPLVYILLAASAVKFIFEKPLDGTVILCVLLFMAIIGFIQEMRAQKAMEALISLASPKARVRRQDRQQQVLSKEVVPGDILILEAGDKVPADARLIELSNLKVNESPFTGESMPVEKNTAIAAQEAPLTERKNMVYMGTTVTYGRATAVVTDTAMASEIGKIAKAIQEIKPEKTPLQKSISKLGHYIIIIVLSGAVFLGLIGVLRGLGLFEVFMLAVAIAVAAIPEGLPAVVTVVLAAGMHIMARRNAIIRRLMAVETLGSTTLICSDKTGTLTVSQMTARKIYLDNQWIEASGEGYQPKGEFSSEKKTLELKNESSLELFLKAGLLCNDALLSKDEERWDILGDPTEGALVVLAAKAGMEKEKLEESFPRLNEIPFQSERQYMATLHRLGDKRQAFIKGSPEKVLSLSKHILKKEGVAELKDKDIRAIEEANKSMAAEAMRVLAVAYIDYPPALGKLKENNIKGKLVFVGLVGMIDPPRPEAKVAIKLCKEAGIKVVMITGDNKLTAESIAQQLEMPPGEAITGKELAQLSDEQLHKDIEHISVFARIEPLHKLRIVEAFKRRGHIVAMTGDGVNDAPALEAASIGIAMGITGTDVAKEAADMVLADDNFASIVAAVEEGRAIFTRLRNVLFFLLSTCMGELFILVSGVLFLGRAPLLPLQILWINMVTGTLGAIPLGLDPKVGDELTHPPRHPAVGLLYRGLLLRIGFFAAIFTTLVILIFNWLQQAMPVERAMSIVFCSVVIFEWFVVFNACSDEETIFKLGFLRNRWLLMALVAATALQLAVVYVPFLQAPFGSVALRAHEWGIAIFPGLIVFIIEVIRKIFFPKMFSRGKFQPGSA